MYDDGQTQKQNLKFYPVHLFFSVEFFYFPNLSL